MKTITVLLLLSFGMFAQPKGANVGTINNSKTASENFKYVGQILLAYGYSFENTDETFFSISTLEKPTSKTYSFYKLQIVCTDGQITVRGTFNSPNMNAQYSPIENKGMGGSPYKVAFTDFAAACDLFGDVTFSVQ